MNLSSLHQDASARSLAQHMIQRQGGTMDGVRITDSSRGLGVRQAVQAVKPPRAPQRRTRSAPYNATNQLMLLHFLLTQGMLGPPGGGV